MITVPLTLSSAYLDSYSAVVNPYFASTHYIDNNNVLYKSVVHPSPIKTFVSPLGTAVHNNDPVVFHHKYHEHTTPTKSSTTKITISSPVSPLMSPVLSPVASPLYNIPGVSHLDVNSDPLLKKKMSAYFFEKTMNDWLYSDFDDVFKYLVVKSGKVSVVQNRNQMEKNKAAQDVEKKVDFIADNVMTKYDMKSFLKKLVIKTPLNWFDLKDHKSFVKKKIYKKIVKNLEKMMVH